MWPGKGPGKVARKVPRNQACRRTAARCSLPVLVPLDRAVGTALPAAATESSGGVVSRDGATVRDSRGLHARRLREGLAQLVAGRRRYAAHAAHKLAAALGATARCTQPHAAARKFNETNVHRGQRRTPSVSLKWPNFTRVPLCFSESLGEQMKIHGGPGHFGLSRSQAVNDAVNKRWCTTLTRKRTRAKTL